MGKSDRAELTAKEFEALESRVASNNLFILIFASVALAAFAGIFVDQVSPMFMLLLMAAILTSYIAAKKSISLGDKAVANLRREFQDKISELNSKIDVLQRR